MNKLALLIPAALVVVACEREERNNVDETRWGEKDVASETRWPDEEDDVWERARAAERTRAAPGAETSDDDPLRDVDPEDEDEGDGSAHPAESGGRRGPDDVLEGHGEGGEPVGEGATIGEGAEPTMGAPPAER